MIAQKTGVFYGLVWWVLARLPTMPWWVWRFWYGFLGATMLTMLRSRRGEPLPKGVFSTARTALNAFVNRSATIPNTRWALAFKTLPRLLFLCALARSAVPTGSIRFAALPEGRSFDTLKSKFQEKWQPTAEEKQKPRLKRAGAIQRRVGEKQGTVRD